MALRDRSLDEKIIAAARDEFLEKGYMGASLRKIAERAGGEYCDYYIVGDKEKV